MTVKIIYVHGLNSSANSVKGRLLQQYCEQNYPYIEVLCPDLNQPPNKVFKRLCTYVNIELKNNNKVILIGSSLGGYFSSLVNNETGCPALLLNPSTRPHISLQRFVDTKLVNSTSCLDSHDTVVYRTKGGWDLTLGDLAWFSSHQLTHLKYPKRIIAVIKSGDELLNSMLAVQFYRAQNAKVHFQQGGDHRMSDFEMQLPAIMSYIESFDN